MAESAATTVRRRWTLREWIGAELIPWALFTMSWLANSMRTQGVDGATLRSDRLQRTLAARSAAEPEHKGCERLLAPDRSRSFADRSTADLAADVLWSRRLFASRHGALAAMEVPLLVVPIAATALAFRRGRLTAMQLLPQLRWVGFAAARRGLVRQRDPGRALRFGPRVPGLLSVVESLRRPATLPAWRRTSESQCTKR